MRGSHGIDISQHISRSLQQSSWHGSRLPPPGSVLKGLEVGLGLSLPPGFPPFNGLYRGIVYPLPQHGRVYRSAGTCGLAGCFFVGEGVLTGVGLVCLFTTLLGTVLNGI